MAQMKPQARLAVVVLGVVLLVPGAFAALPSSSPMVVSILCTQGLVISAAALCVMRAGKEINP